MSVFVDTSAFLAISNVSDRQHSAAVKTWQRLVDDREVVVTSNYVVVETSALLHSRHGLGAVARFVGDLLSVVLVQWVEPAAHASAMSALLSGSANRGPSFVDCTSLQIIRGEKIDTVFAYDRHFERREFTLIG